MIIKLEIVMCLGCRYRLKLMLLWFCVIFGVPVELEVKVVMVV